MWTNRYKKIVDEPGTLRYDLRKLPLIERQTHLKKIINGTGPAIAPRVLLRFATAVAAEI